MNRRCRHVFIILMFITSCNLSNSQELPLFSTNTFEGVYRDFIIAVDKEDTSAMTNLINQYKLDVNHKDSIYGISLLRWAISNKKLLSFEKLLRLGANPNQTDSIKELVPVVTVAARDSNVFLYLKLILEHGGNPNAQAGDLKKVQYTEMTPLCAAVSTSLQNVKLLIEHGADIEFNPYSYFLPLTVAILSDKIDIARYLILERSANIQKVYTVRINNDTVRIEDMLRLNVYPLESKEYRYKMEIVEYLKTQGIDYRSTPIPKYLYNNYSKDFLDKY